MDSLLVRSKDASNWILGARNLNRLLFVQIYILLSSFSISLAPLQVKSLITALEGNLALAGVPFLTLLEAFTHYDAAAINPMQSSTGVTKLPLITSPGFRRQRSRSATVAAGWIHEGISTRAIQTSNETRRINDARCYSLCTALTSHFGSIFVRQGYIYLVTPAWFTEQ